MISLPSIKNNAIGLGLVLRLGLGLRLVLGGSGWSGYRP
jgi:hypothetical protein